MTTNTHKLVSELPEIYQTIFGHPEWDGDAARDCNERLALISEEYDSLSRELGRPLRVLDLGCAQGFFSLSLASKGASVLGIDFLQQNIDVCQALAEENPHCDVRFQVGRIEDIISTLEENQFDLAIGLSVFHHIVHLHGIAEVRTLLERLANLTQAMILELAVKEEPLYWGESQPEDPRELIEQCAFYRLIGIFDTHLSNISRPMYIISNHRVILPKFNQPFTSWRDSPYRGAGFAHKQSRRYYFSSEFICKFYRYSTVSGLLTDKESERNRTELAHEEDFLKSPPSGLKVPALFTSGGNEAAGWLVMEKIPGDLLNDVLSSGRHIDREKVISDLLDQLVILEEHGLYHDDFRTWNVLIDDNDSARLIDFGSVGRVQQDCSWPVNIFQSFIIFVNELFSENKSWGGFWRSAPLSPFQLPEPYSNWLTAFWKHPVGEWNFALLQQLFNTKDTLPAASSAMDASDLWVRAQEPVLLEGQTQIRNTDARVVRLESQINELTSLINMMGESIQTLEKREYPPQDVITDAQHCVKVEQSQTVDSEEVMQLHTQLNDARQEVDNLSHEIAKIHNSRSWKMTKWYRYAGMQYYLLRQYGFRQRCKHLLKRVLGKIFFFLRAHPRLKQSVINLLHKVGIYDFAYRLHRRINPGSHNPYQNDSQNQSQTEKQILHPELLPPEVNSIFSELKKKG